MAAVIAHEAGAQRVHGIVLQPRVERGANLQAVAVERGLAVFAIKLAAHFLDEIVGVDGLTAKRTRLDVQRLGDRDPGLLLGDVTVLGHLADHPVAALEGGLEVIARIVVAGAFGQRGEIGGLGDVDLVERFAEIVERCRRDAVGVLAEKDFVEIKLEDLVLRIGRVDADREDRFLDLAGELDVAVEQEVSRHLLGDGRGAFRTLDAAGR